MERLLFLWDELDDLVGLARHFGRNVSGDAQATWRGAKASMQAGLKGSLRGAQGPAGLKIRAAAPNLPRR